MCEIGIEPHVVEELLNHKSGHKSGVAGIYNRARYAKQKKVAMERGAAHVDAVVSGENVDNVTRSLGRVLINRQLTALNAPPKVRYLAPERTSPVCCALSIAVGRV